jgi:rhamnogalacturonyl hydrolase YesR
MFTFAMVTGVKNGWLDRKVYGPAARKAWMGLIKHIDSEANVSDVCIGTNKAAQEVGPNLDTQMKYYFDRARRTGDLHGQTPVLWSATALLR